MICWLQSFKLYLSFIDSKYHTVYTCEHINNFRTELVTFIYLHISVSNASLFIATRQ
jgi:hypothetical protein